VFSVRTVWFNTKNILHFPQRVSFDTDKKTTKHAVFSVRYKHTYSIYATDFSFILPTGKVFTAVNIDVLVSYKITPCVLLRRY
jgi:hypothetical protein